MKLYPLKICLMVLAPFFMAGQVLATECNIDADECTPKQLCAAATTEDNGQKVWSTDINFAAHVETAKTIGIECGVVETVTSCESDAALCSVMQLCEQATTVKDNQTVWKTGQLAADYVAMAKKYDLSCGVTNYALFIDYASKKHPICWVEISPSETTATKHGRKVTVRRRNVSSIVAFNPSMPGNQEILFTYGYPVEKDTASLNLEGENINLDWIIGDPTDAFRPPRNKLLDIVDTISTGQTMLITGCSSRGTLTTDKFNMAELSQNLTNLMSECENGNPLIRQKKWPFNVNNASTNKAPDDTKNLGNLARCNDGNSTNITRALTTKVTKKTSGFLGKNFARCANGEGFCVVVETQALKNAFVRLDTIERKKIQAALARLNYYHAAVDALYGPATEEAIINFAMSKDLDVKYPQGIFKSLEKAAPLLRYAIINTPVKTTEAGLVSQKVSRIISQNLKETGQFEHVKSDSLNININNFSVLSDTSRRKVMRKNVQFIIFNSNNLTDLGDLNLTFRIFDIFKKEKSDEFEIKGSAADLNAMAKKVTVRIQQRLQKSTFGKTSTQSQTSSESEAFDFNIVLSAFKNASLEHATVLLQDFKSNYPNSPFIAQAYLLQGQAQELSGDIKNAGRSYLESYNSNETGKTAPQALLRLARTMVNLNNKDAACRMFNATSIQFPKSAESNLAKDQFVKLGCS